MQPTDLRRMHLAAAAMRNYAQFGACNVDDGLTAWNGGKKITAKLCTVCIQHAKMRSYYTGLTTKTSRKMILAALQNVMEVVI